jgi:hypothetical protein
MASPDEAAALPAPAAIETDPSSSFVCDYPAGINRVLSLPPYLLIDNIARNVELWRFDAGAHRPAARARYDRTSYPGDPDASLLDLDIHAAFVRGEGQELLTVNHFGRVRRYTLPPQADRMSVTGERQLLGDMERIVLVGDAFIGSSPRGEYTADEARPGIFLFEPLRSWTAEASGSTGTLACEQTLADWGVVSALAASPSGTLLAVASGPRFGLFDLEVSPAGVRLGPCVLESRLPFHGRWLQFDEADRIWIAGHRQSTDAGNDRDECGGGHLVVLSRPAGAPELAVDLPDVAAWGYGADPIVLAPGCREVYVLGRDGSLHAIDLSRRVAHAVYRGVETPGGGTIPSLGIGHAAMRDRSIYAGFSRGGFRLLHYALPPL